MSDSEILAMLASEATAVERSLYELLVRRRSASAKELAEIDTAIEQVRDLKKDISEQAAAITVRQIEERLQRARASADPDGPRLDMDNFVRALDQGLGWRRDESSFIEDGIRKLPTYSVVAAWDDGSFIHFVLHVVAGAQDGYLGYCYEDDPSRWSWRVADIEMQEVSVLSDLWFYGENLVPKIEGADPEEIRWQAPVPDKYLPTSVEDLRSVDLGMAAWVNPEYFPAT
ncbi:hypothetical protein COCCU_04765 [Corynebacterium occultum]|uniref:Uncharacterized protein n=1 Tax=Corynebacterium occultum TaxID=2675219 RepID=A0A6B8VUY2_9CORY|nr:hypothetical protein [Corynebacterium occultum]QGU06899.1 hypothetical protein COCCU_04765 [Corynebacterium occultum]